MLVTRLHDAFDALQPQFLEFRAIGLELRSQLVHVVGFLVNGQTFYLHRILDNYLRILEAVVELR